jgi:hypothetical protein
VGGGRQRHFVPLDAGTHAFIELSHESRISPMNPTSRREFERPRVERPQVNHCSPAAGRRHTRFGAGVQAVAVHSCGQQGGQSRAARGLAGCTVGNHHQTHRTRTRRSVRRGWVRGAHGDGDWLGGRERHASAGLRRSVADCPPAALPVVLNSRGRRPERAGHPPHRADASHGVPRYVLHARFVGEGLSGPERL